MKTICKSLTELFQYLPSQIKRNALMFFLLEMNVAYNLLSNLWGEVM